MEEKNRPSIEEPEDFVRPTSEELEQNQVFENFEQSLLEKDLEFAIILLQEIIPFEEEQNNQNNQDKIAELEAKLYQHFDQFIRQQNQQMQILAFER